MSITIGQRLKIAYRQGKRTDRMIVGLVVSVTREFFTVQTLMGYRESINFIDLKTDRARILEASSEQKEKPLETEETVVEKTDNKVLENEKHQDVVAMTDDDIRAWIEKSGQKGLLSPDMVRKHPPDELEQLVEEGLSTKEIKTELSVGGATLHSLRKLYGLAGTKAKKKPAKKPPVLKEAFAELTEIERPILEINYKGAVKTCTEMAEFVANTLISLRDNDEDGHMDIQVVVRRV